jgi:single-stranded-DNA-specific exonuclease
MHGAWLDPSLDDPAVVARARELLAAGTVICHDDADGLSSGAIALRATDRTADDAVLMARGRTPWQDDTELPAGPLAVLDWGIQPLDRPALYVDHHALELDTLRDDQVAVCGAGASPEVTTSVLMGRLAPEVPRWLAAVGAVGDLGDRGLALPEFADGIVKAHVRRLATLVNSPRRMPDGPLRTALAILVDADTAKEALADPRIEQLEEAKAWWRSEFEQVIRTAPVFGDLVAVLEFSTRAHVHALVAMQWSRTLRPRPVLAANHGFLDDRVNFSVRCADPTLDLRALLRAALPDEAGEFAHGHPQATGGSLTVERFAELLAALGVASRRPVVPAWRHVAPRARRR